jgi:serine/threonine protein phosphatase PrpC
MAMNESQTTYEDGQDTGELTMPVTNPDTSGVTAGDSAVPPEPGTPNSSEETGAADTEGEIVTGVIAIPRPKDQQTAIITNVAGQGEVPEVVEERVMRVAKRCHMGGVRDRNEDSCLVFVSEAGGHFALMPFGLYIVADGMGGHDNGHVASKIASRQAARQIIENIYLPMLGDGSSPIQEVMTEAVRSANSAIFNDNPDSDSGTTLSIALILDRRLYIAHVGDSRVYLYSNGALEMVTTDHSLVQRLQDVGQLTDAEAQIHDYRHVLIRAVGQTEEVEVDAYMRRLPKTGRLLLCSDGLTSMLMDDDKIQEILARDISVDEAVDQLLEAALEAGGFDNITIVLVDFTL